MSSITKSPRNTALLLIFSFIIGALILINAPAEQTLGRGITSIYVHVAFIWTGLTGLTLSVVLGVLVVWKQSLRLQSWAHTITTIGLFAFLVGMALSLVAARVNWGGVLLDEPRFRNSLNVVAVTVIVLVLTTWVHNIRLRGLLHVIPGIYVMQTILFTRLVLHPPSPTVMASVTSIQIVFFSLFAICLFCCAWLVLFIQSRRPPTFA